MLPALLILAVLVLGALAARAVAARRRRQRLPAVLAACASVTAP
jgi:hypothetical protein